MFQFKQYFDFWPPRLEKKFNMDERSMKDKKMRLAFLKIIIAWALDENASVTDFLVKN